MSIPMIGLKMPRALYPLALMWLCLPLTAHSSPSANGTSGLLAMPDGRVAVDGSWSLGLSRHGPYQTLWSSLGLLPRLEVSGRYTEIKGTDLGHTEGWQGYGAYKDKAFDAKLLLLREDRYTPALSLGWQDWLGTRLFSARYLAFGKRLGDMDLSLGYGEGRLDGWFGGLNYQPSWAGHWSLLLEYDAYRYGDDPLAGQSDAGRLGGWSYGLEYRWGWLGSRLFRQGDQYAINAYLSIPLQQRQFIPHFEEPPPPQGPTQHHSLKQWRSDPVPMQVLLDDLRGQGFQNVHIHLVGSELQLSFSHGRISLISRAVGRAARTALRHAPQGLQALTITYSDRDLSLLTYHFAELEKLQAYFEKDGVDELLALEMASRISHSRQPRESVPVQASTTSDSGDTRIQQDAADPGTLVVEDGGRNFLRFKPFNLNLYFNDPSGAYHYDIFTSLLYTRKLARGTFFNSALRYRLLEDVTKVKQLSNSQLPHVRSDIALYKQEGPAKLDQLYLNHYLQPSDNWYLRLSAGLYEEMYSGAGLQALYLSEGSRWAVDLALDRLAQRDYEGGFGLLDYRTTTALLSLHYQLPLGVSTTLRGGRFLAGDDGLRLELQRRFASGITFGLWYSRTNGEDVTSPGSIEEPYYDKGVYLSVPLRSMLTKDTRHRASMSIAAWTRDVGQMVRSPGDLYTLLEHNHMMADEGYYPFMDFTR